jgi:ribonucleoside-diphosphate reductase alpha chain
MVVYLYAWNNNIQFTPIAAPEMIRSKPIFITALKESFYSDELMKRIAKKGNVKDFPEIPKSVQAIYVTAHDITPEWHVKMQAAFQKFTDNAVSKTVNLCHDATKEDVRDVFLLADRLFCKGVTIYRDGSRDFQVLNVGKVKGKEEAKSDGSEGKEAAGGFKNHITPRPRPDITTGFTEKVRIGCGNLYITVNYDEHGICEVFTNTGRAGGCPSQSEATSRLVSIALRSGLEAKAIVEQLKGIRCPSTIRQKDLKVLSCPDAIGRLIEKVLKLQNGNGNGNGNGLSNGSGSDNGNGNASSKGSENGTVNRDGSGNSNSAIGKSQNDVNFSFIPKPTANCESQCSECSMKDTCNNNTEVSDDGRELSRMAYCPECGKKVEHEGGCVVCRNCGYSKCG